jgi:UDP-glucose 4-epimerase
LKIIVTGSSGFVGGAFGRVAARYGHTLLGVGRASQAELGWPGEHAQADVLNSDLSELIAAFRPHILMHAAGTASVSASFKYPLDDLRAAALTWANVLDSVRRSGERPLLVFPSSAAVYGQPRALPVGEDEPARPISPYGFHKAACELLAREYAECFGARVLVCRLFSVFGERQRRLLVWELYRQFADFEPGVWLEGTGEETRDYLHVDDAAHAMLALCGELGYRKAEGLTTVNVASGVETRVLDLAERIREYTTPETEIRCHGRERAGDPVRWLADTTRLRSFTDWRPRPLEDRLSQCISAWQAEENF